MSLYGAFDRTKLLSELGDPFDSQGEGVISAATQRQTALRNLTGDSNITVAQLTVLSGVTPGTVTASKAVVVDANKDIGTLRNITISGFLSNTTTHLALNSGTTATDL